LEALIFTKYDCGAATLRAPTIYTVLSVPVWTDSFNVNFANSPPLPTEIRCTAAEKGRVLILMTETTDETRGCRPTMLLPAEHPDVVGVKHR